MKIINNHENLKEKFCNLPEGIVFKVNDRYYMKLEAMFLYSDIDCLLEDSNIRYTEDIEAECPIINAICFLLKRYSSINLPTCSCSFLDILLYPYPGKSTK